MQSQWFSSVKQISEEVWRKAIGSTYYPFAQYAFYYALEASHSIGSDSGWHPEYLLLSDENDVPIAIVPTFLKLHSQAEFVFDWAWADAYQRNGLPYYPKRVWAIPFTPVTGPRLFSKLDPSGKLPVLNDLYHFTSQLLIERTRSQQLSSWHLLFTQADRLESVLANTSPEHQLLSRISCQFHWFNRDYQDMEHYLSFFSSRKRKTVRKERQKVVAQGISVERKLGIELTSEEVEFFYLCYQSTYAKRGQYGYLTEAFFQQLIAEMGEKILVVFASHQQEPVAASWCFFDDHSLYGRYWGCIREYDSLHFEVCYYQGIEFCLEKGLRHFDPGTQGEHKIARGFEPVFSHSVHYIDHPAFRAAIGDFCKEEAEAVRKYHRETQMLLPFKQEE